MLNDYHDGIKFCKFSVYTTVKEYAKTYSNIIIVKNYQQLFIIYRLPGSMVISGALNFQNTTYYLLFFTTGCCLEG